MDKWDGRECMVSRVVLKDVVHVSIVTMIFEGSATPLGISETKIGLNGGGVVDRKAGNSGTAGGSSVLGRDPFLREGRRDGGGAGGSARTGLEGYLGGSTPKSLDSSSWDEGSGGRGGLFGGE